MVLNDTGDIGFPLGLGLSSVSARLFRTHNEG